MKNFEKYLLIVTFSLAFLGIIGLMPQIVSILLLLSACIYLFIGWRLLSPITNGKIQFIPLVISYLIAQTILTIIFGIQNYPLGIDFSYVTSILLFIAIVLILIKNKTLATSYPTKKYLVRLILCIMFSVAPLWMGIINKA